MIPGCNQIRFTNTLKCRSPCLIWPVRPVSRSLEPTCDNLPAASRCLSHFLPSVPDFLPQPLPPDLHPKVVPHLRSELCDLLLSYRLFPPRYSLHVSHNISYSPGSSEKPVKHLLSCHFPFCRAPSELSGYTRGNSSDPSFRSPSVTANDPHHMVHGQLSIIV